MSWIQVTARLKEAPEDWSPFIDVFVRHGMENTLQTDHPPTVESCVVEVEGVPSILDALEADLLALGVAEVVRAPYVEQDWDQIWRLHFKPRRVGRRFLIVPSWEEIEPREDDWVIELDPGQAFGTGDHPTTRMCLELMEDAPIEGARVADVGCGSGILSIGACRMGAREVCAVDIEPVSVEVARENAERNGVSFRAVAGDGLFALPEGDPYDVVLSNIISAVLIRIAPDVAAEVRPGGAWVVSGVISDNWPDVLRAAERVGFHLQERREEDGWVAARFVR